MNVYSSASVFGIRSLEVHATVNVAYDSYLAPRDV